MQRIWKTRVFIPVSLQNCNTFLSCLLSLTIYAVPKNFFPCRNNRFETCCTITFYSPELQQTIASQEHAISFLEVNWTRISMLFRKVGIDLPD